MTTEAVTSAELCEECPLHDPTEIGGAVYAGGHAFLRETPPGVAVAWETGDELHLERWQVVKLHELLAEHAERWR